MIRENRLWPSPGEADCGCAMIARPPAPAIQKELAPPFSGPMKLITLTLFGQNPLYTTGAIENAKLCGQVFPDWTLRVYHNDSVPGGVIGELRRLGAETVDTGEPSNAFATLWRFYPMSEPGVTHVISRDCDSRLSLRDRCAVDQWLASGKRFHIIRDHPVGHFWVINAGMWGCRNDHDLDFRALIRDYLAANDDPDFLAVDQCFLRDVIYPRAREDVFVNDEYFDYEKIGVRIARDRRLDDFAFIGEAFGPDNRPIGDRRQVIRTLEELRYG